MAEISLGLSFDDVLLVPAMSAVLPSETDLSTHVTADIPLHIPVVSAAMDTVSEHDLAVALARPSTLLLPLASPYTFAPLLMMSPAGFFVARKVTTPNAAPGVLLPPASTVPEPSLRRPCAVIWKPSTIVRNSDAPEPNPRATRLAALPSLMERR